MTAGACSGVGTIAKFDANGGTVTGFATNGVARQTSSWRNNYDVVVEPGGEAVASGVIGGAYGSSTRAVLTRVGATGLADAAYNAKTTSLDLIEGPDSPHALLLQPDRKVVVALGGAQLDSIDFGLARFEAGGELVPPKVSVALRKHAAKTLRQTGRLPIRIDADEAATVEIDCVLKFYGRHGRKRRTESTASFDLSHAGRKLTSMNIAQGELKKLRLSRKAKVRLAVVAQDRNKNRASETVKRTLRLKRRGS